MVRANPDRTREIMRMVAEGKTRRTIAAHYGISTSAIQEIVTRERSKNPIDKADEIASQASMLDELIELASEVARLRGAPVTAGKDGDVVYDPATNEVVRDHGGRLQAMQTVKALQERKAKLLGLDSAVKAEVQASITYTIQGADPDNI